MRSFSPPLRVPCVLFSQRPPLPRGRRSDRLCGLSASLRRPRAKEARAQKRFQRELADVTLFRILLASAALMKRLASSSSRNLSSMSFFAACLTART